MTEVSLVHTQHRGRNGSKIIAAEHHLICCKRWIIATSLSAMLLLKNEAIGSRAESV